MLLMTMQSIQVWTTSRTCFSHVLCNGAEYIEERPSAAQAQQWLVELGMEKVDVTEWPLEIASGPDREFLEHPLLRGGFLDDIYECFADQELAEEFMTTIAADLKSFLPLIVYYWSIGGFSLLIDINLLHQLNIVSKSCFLSVSWVRSVLCLQAWC